MTLGREGAPRGRLERVRASLEWVRMQAFEILVALLAGLLAVFTVVGFFDPAWVHDFFFGAPEGTEGAREGTGKFRILEFVGVGMGGVLLAIGATIAHRRAAAMEETAKAQAKAAEAQAEAAAQQAAANRGAEDGRRQERLKNAIEHLGHESDSVRMGGAYELFHLARDTEDLRQTAMDILCAHIRRTTGEDDYREKHTWRPSEEVQSLLTLLFVQERETSKGCRVDLRDSWLNGVHLQNGRLEGVIFHRAHLKAAMLYKTKMQGADFMLAQMQGAYLMDAHMQGANLTAVNLQEANMRRVHMQETNITEGQLQGADMKNVYLQGAVLCRTKMQGTNLENANMQGVQAVDSFRTLTNIIIIFPSLESDLSETIFEGGLSRDDVDSFVNDLPGYAVNEFRRKLEPHIDRPPSHELPEGSGAIVGTYTREEAGQWIAEYREAMRGVPKAGG